MSRKVWAILVGWSVMFGAIGPAGAVPASASKGAKAAATAKPVPQSANRVAVMRFSGPEIYDVDVDEVWKAKTHLSGPTNAELSKVTDALQIALTQRLSQRLGKLVVPLQELKQSLGSAPLTVSSQGKTSPLPKSLKVRYIVSGRIERLEFDGNTILDDVYVLFPAARITEAASGQEVWSCPIKKYRKKTRAAKSGKSVSSVFADLLIPDIADDLAAQISQALGH